MSRTKRVQLDPAIRRVPLPEIKIFDVTEAELEELERGSPESLFLNLGIAALSTAVSFSASLSTATVGDLRVFCVIVIITVVSYLASITFGLLWWQGRRSAKSVIRRIRTRIPPEGIQEAALADEAEATVPESTN